ncbi:CaiB/BaiF CoA transferase family protein [Roseococcus suduntuyensis]|uniref:Crotonobetainyl-CoA:carnitine CoA-transferase CaiB-like acyl-CoA transferase n=1 Tax=Roseococcus suduntuyensis TaxID=455361 RepID=A0A840AI08_9PROT|nr:CoA transferase [Roseococcus suduntuyensis]MBB3900186.1 crotonobetainyl-CoA:carnitine CoA-transferase CaiB-like acyl-CoA transferase [Roseococcus suduntuyensis]
MTEQRATGAALPLAGLCVFEFGHSVAAPFAGQILGDMGAEVIKVEKPAGDDARRWGPPFWEGESAIFQTLNRGKRSLCLDLRDPVALARLKALVLERGDVVLQNMRPGQAESLGLGAEALLAQKPSLVCCNLGAFGRTGPLAEAPGYDPLMQAFGGLMSVTGEAGRPAVRVGVSMVDMGTGMWAVIGILAALQRRAATGMGGVVDVSLFETAAAWMSVPVAQFLASGEAPERQGSGAQGIVPYRAYRTADGELVVAAGNDALFRALARVLERPDWLHDPRFATNPDRVAHQAVLYPLIEAEMVRRPTAEWTARLDAAGIPCAPVQDVGQMLDHPQTRALGLLQNLPSTGVSAIGLPVAFDGTRPAPRGPVPARGADNALLDDTPKEAPA